jgi:hypothetical protein
MNRRLLVNLFAGLALISLLVTVSACSGDDDDSASNTPTAMEASGTTSTATAGGGLTTAATSGTGSASGICTKIPQADVQALIPQKITSVTGSNQLLECHYHFTPIAADDSSDLVVGFRLDDGDQSSYKNLSDQSDHAVSGIGDMAYWNEPVPSRTSPELSAHKGKVTCIIQPTDPPETTLKYTGTLSFVTIDDADALAYVQLMGKVCNDVFAAAG